MEELQGGKAVSSTVPDGPHKVFLGGLPYHITEAQLAELLGVFGRLKALHLVRDPGSTTCRGYGFCEFAETSARDLAQAGLHGQELGGKLLTVRRANPGMEAPGGGDGGGGASTAAAAPVAATSAPAPPSMGDPPLPPAPAGSSAGGVATPPLDAPSRALRLLHMVTPEDLAASAAVYEDIKADIASELAKSGVLLRLEMPRRGPHALSVLALFATAEGASAARRALSGRAFAGRSIVAEPEREELLLVEGGVEGEA